MDHLLISTPNLVACGRIRGQLALAGIYTDETQLGLEVWCRELDWRDMLESIAVMLSDRERCETRVAVVRRSEDPAALERAIFAARPLDELMRELRQDWLEALLERGRIAVHFQPLMQHPAGRVHGYECLARGVDSEGKLIFPAAMFDAAARSGQLRALDQWCRSEAIRAAADLADAKLMFFVNFVPSTVTEPKRTLAELLRQLGEGPLRPEHVVFEVVETDKITDYRQTQSILRSFRKAGFKVALDDVGAGYASLLALSYLRPDYIKLDGELVRRATCSGLEAKIVRDLAETARQHGIITIAEGVETADELRLVLGCGIPVSQGYFHARPGPRPLSSGEIDVLAGQIAAVAARSLPGPII